jgi:UDPglucose 6-dehydrogenase
MEGSFVVTGREFKTISIVGLGKLGAPMAACLAAKGFPVIGVDVDAQKVNAINNAQAPVFEPGLPELLQVAKTRLKATQDILTAVLNSEVTFVVVPTPSEPDGSFSLRYVLQACEGIADALKRKPEWHLVVITSTISPGSMDTAIRPFLEERSGKRSGVDFGMCYNPEFIALGSVIRDFLNPDFVLIGESDERSGQVLEGIYRQVCENDPPIVRMNFINAELTKLAVNTFVTTKISFANMLARICERLPGADVDVVTRALGLDSRIGAKYLKGAVSYGGPCFPRDNLALIATARKVGAPADIAEATDRFNRWQVKWLADFVQEHLPEGGAVGILGLAYKPGTDVVEESVGLLLARELREQRVRVIAYDPAGVENARRMLGDGVIFVNSPQACIDLSDIVVVATPWKEFHSLPGETWERHSPPRVVIDCWRVLRGLEGCGGVIYVPLGKGGLRGC